MDESKIKEDEIPAINTRQIKHPRSHVIAVLLGSIFGILSMTIMVPLAIIWSLNILFKFGIPYTFSTWLASCFLCFSLKIISPIKNSLNTRNR